MRFNFSNYSDVRSPEFARLSRRVLRLGCFCGVALPALMFYMDYAETRVG